jgi:hypothetical protein
MSVVVGERSGTRRRTAAPAGGLACDTLQERREVAAEAVARPAPATGVEPGTAAEAAVPGD